ncbi:MAG: nicotinate-nucleotide adenylyltransferase [Candidatus Omnitrophica bacterium]|nr:nicotinate-nucleotide adenylyltransferase [Candidatus Omnitrophota bacterium]
MKVGILGGTFNPIHNGHLILAEECLKKLGLEKVIFVPTHLAPHKDNSDVTEAADRLTMVKMAITANLNFTVSDVEIARGGYSYTIDTIRELKKRYPGDDLYFIAGSDLLKYLDDWKDLNEIIKMVKFIVATRPGYPLESIPSYIQTAAIDAADISGYRIRCLIKEGSPFQDLLPPAVFDYISKKGLYK